MTTFSTWPDLFKSLWHGEPWKGASGLVRGVDIDEWLALFQSDWTETDALLLDYETIGG